MRIDDFWHSTGDFGDWFVTIRDNAIVRTRLERLGAVRVARGAGAAYLINLPTPTERLICGPSIVDGRFASGPRTCPHSDKSVIGNCEILDFFDDHIVVQGDLISTRPVYYSDWFVTNRIQLASYFVDGVNVEAASATIFTENVFSQQLNTVDTPLPGVRILLNNQVVKIDSTIQVRSKTDDPVSDVPISKQDYWSCIHAGADEIKSNVQAALNSGFPVGCALTGGKDSRVNFAALVALGALDSVHFRTSDVGDDIAVATGLVKKFGGSYRHDVASPTFHVRSIEDALSFRRSHKFGLYHLTPKTDFSQVISESSVHNLQLEGGLGEFYRSLYQPMVYSSYRKHEKSIDLDDIATRANVESMFRTISWRMLGSWQSQFERACGPILTTFDALPGRTLAEKLDHHYANFRGRMHFGLGSSRTFGKAHGLNTLVAPSLLKAARGLPSRERITGRVIFDVTKVLSEEVAHAPYDKPFPESVFTSHYHIKNSYEDRTVSIDPDRSLIFRRPSPAAPKAPEFDMRAFMKDACLESFEAIKTGALAELATPQLKKKVNWVVGRDRPSLSNWYSRLSALADFGKV